MFHLYIKYHMAMDILVGWGDLIFSIYYLECNSDILHLLPRRILPESVVILFVKSHTFIPALWSFNSKLVSPIVVTFEYSGDNYGASLQDMGPTALIRWHGEGGIETSLPLLLLKNSRGKGKLTI
jgi:hypothetical protein